MDSVSAPVINPVSDALAQLPPLVLPEEPGVWPLTPAWWMLILLIAICLIVSVLWAIRWWKKNRLRRESLALLQNHWEQYQHSKDGLNFCRLVNVLLRRVCLSSDRGKTLAALATSNWLEQLNQLTADSCFDTRCNTLLYSYYQRDIQINDNDATHLYQCAERWLRYAQWDNPTIRTPIIQRLPARLTRRLARG